MHLYLLLVLLINLVQCRVLKLYSTVSVFEKLNDVPDGWVAEKRPDSLQSIRLHIALADTTGAFEVLEQILLNISTPDHESYGQHVKLDTLTTTFQSTKQSTSPVIDWLQTAGIRNISHQNGLLSFKCTIRDAEELLHTNFTQYHHKLRRSSITRTLEYSVPKRIQHLVRMIQPTTYFGLNSHREIAYDHQKSKSRRDVHRFKPHTSSFCHETIDPTCLKDLYNIRYEADPRNGNKVALASFLGEAARHEDFSLFNPHNAPYAKDHNFSTVQINAAGGGQVCQNCSWEANMDIQYLGAISYPVPLVEYRVLGVAESVPDLDHPGKDGSHNEPFLEFLQYMLALPDDELPQTLSISYGDNEQSVPVSYARTVCSLFAQLGARGVSVLVASGDSGVGSACQTNDSLRRTRFTPHFPASCPWVTAVGGTEKNMPEQAMNRSQGGFSDIFSRPSYQDAAVLEYLATLGNRWEGFFNPEGRGFPDVAAQMHYYQIFDKNEEIIVSGTSAATPVFAGIIALLNAARISSSKPPLGFLNPWLYSQGRYGLNDIIHGCSTGCTGVSLVSGMETPFVPNAGWNATTGWDPVTGLGTPDQDKLISILDLG